LGVVVLPVVALGLLGVGVASCLHLSSDTRALRSEVARASGAEWQKQIGLSLGAVTLGAVRAGLACAPLDPEARAALRAVRGVELGIYKLDARSRRPDCATMLAAMDGVLSPVGWERVVGVLEGEQMVGVYLRAGSSSTSQAQCCVVVDDGNQLVVVNVRADLNALLDLMHNQAREWSDLRSLAKR
jgi:hypothetical protein